MPGSSNFQVFNPNQANAETDATYQADAQRVGGVIDGQPWFAALANKFLYQNSVGLAALMDMMAAKGFVVSDQNRGTLASVLAAIQTTADIKLPLLGVNYSPTVTLDFSRYSGFQITVAGDMIINVTGQSPGQQVWIMLTNDPAGNHAVTMPLAEGELHYDNSGNAQSQILLQVVSDNTIRALGPGISASGINGTPIGQTGSPSAGKFAALIAAASTLASLGVSGNALVSGNLTVLGIAAVTQFLATIGISGSDGFAFQGDTQTGVFSPTPGSLYLLASGVIAIAMGATGITVPLGTLFQGNVTFNGGTTLNGNVAGNPNFVGTPTASTPGANDNSARIPNTSWVQALITAVFGTGFAASIGPNGWIKFPTGLGGLVIQWGQTSTFNGNASFNFPISFPTNCFVVVTNPSNTGGHANFSGINSTSTTGFSAYNDGAGSPAMYIAIGN